MPCLTIAFARPVSGVAVSLMVLLPRARRAGPRFPRRRKAAGCCPRTLAGRRQPALTVVPPSRCWRYPRRFHDSLAFGGGRARSGGRVRHWRESLVFLRARLGMAFGRGLAASGELPHFRAGARDAGQAAVVQRRRVTATWCITTAASAAPAGAPSCRSGCPADRRQPCVGNGLRGRRSGRVCGPPFACASPLHAASCAVAATLPPGDEWRRISLEFCSTRAAAAGRFPASVLFAAAGGPGRVHRSRQSEPE